MILGNTTANVTSRQNTVLRAHYWFKLFAQGLNITFILKDKARDQSS